MKRLFDITLALLITAGVCMAASNTVSYTDGHSIKTITITWNNIASSGHIAAAPTNDITCTVTSKIVAGWIDRIEVSSVNATGAFYTVTLKDANGIDLLGGVGAQRSTTAPYAIYVTNVPLESAMYLHVTNACGSATTNSGSISIIGRFDPL